MNSVNCIKCDILVNDEAAFCFNCGTRLQCKSCNAKLLTGANFCQKCGEPTVTPAVMDNGTSALNTIKYKKSKDEISCEISFTDQVGKSGMDELISAIVNNSSNNNRQLNNVNANNNASVTYDDNVLAENINAEVDEDTKSEDIAEVTTSNPETVEIIHLNDVENNIECSENEWIAIYAFYESEFGKKNFTRESVRERYLKKRKTVNRDKNFGREWKKSQKQFFSTVNDTELKIKHDSIGSLNMLIKGQKSTIVSKNTKKNIGGNTSKTQAKSVVIEEFDLHKSTDGKKISLNDFLNQKKPGDSTYDRIVCIAYYITRINKVEYFSEGNIEYAYKALQLGNRSKHLRQTVNNIKSTKVWFKDYQEPGKWTLERIGEIYVDESLPAINKQK
ncbi:zinc ribbon domain-containing protein [Mucilaginibacter sp.]|uniref:zinc ribbon domain-containing protein n=1 Tax=Mucilaginibacter sp. TaxID=1882438 RepID=UPI003D1534A4